MGGESQYRWWLPRFDVVFTENSAVLIYFLPRRQLDFFRDRIFTPRKNKRHNQDEPPKAGERRGVKIKIKSTISTNQWMPKARGEPVAVGGDDDWKEQLSSKLLCMCEWVWSVDWKVARDSDFGFCIALPWSLSPINLLKFIALPTLN